MRGERRLKYLKAGHRMWGEGHIDQTRGRHPSGSFAGLALELMANTSQRRGDIIRMGPQHLRNGMWHLRQHKTGGELRLPIHADLAAELPKEAGHLFFLTTEAGAALVLGNSFYNKFKRWCAEAGCTPVEIMAITGHKTLAEVERYRWGADKTRFALRANARLRLVLKE